VVPAGCKCINRRILVGVAHLRLTLLQVPGLLAKALNSNHAGLNSTNGVLKLKIKLCSSHNQALNWKFRLQNWNNGVLISEFELQGWKRGVLISDKLIHNSLRWHQPIRSPKYRIWSCTTGRWSLHIDLTGWRCRAVHLHSFRAGEPLF